MIAVIVCLAALLQLVDGVQTYTGLARSGIREANPLARALMDRIGVCPALVLIKGGMAALFAGLALLVRVQAPGWWPALLPALAVMVLVVLNNHRLLRRG